MEILLDSLLSSHKSKLDLSSSDLNGSHTTALKGAEQVGYQGRKSVKPQMLYTLPICKVYF